MLEADATDRELLDHFVHDQDRGIPETWSCGTARRCIGSAAVSSRNRMRPRTSSRRLSSCWPAGRRPFGEPEALGGWLRGVAYRVAVRARRRARGGRDGEGAGRGVAGSAASSPAEGTFELRELVGQTSWIGCPMTTDGRSCSATSRG